MEENFIPPEIVVSKDTFIEEYEVFEAENDTDYELESEEEKPKISHYSLDSQKEIVNRFKINLPEKEIYQLNEIDEGTPNDQKFMNKLLLILFDRKTLAYSSVSGKTNKNNKFDANKCKKLDSSKVEFIKGEFHLNK